MNLNASLIDQRLAQIQDEIRPQAQLELGMHDAGRLKSLSFVYLCVKTMLDLDAEQAFDCLTEGSGDFGVDAMHIGEESDGEFSVTLFQGKYKGKLDGTSHFDGNGIDKLIHALRHIFDPATQLAAINPRLASQLETARSLIRDGLIPQVRVLACNNGLRWNTAAQAAIDRTGWEQVVWEHVNHDTLIHILQRMKPVNETLRLTGKALVEDMHFSRVCVGRVAVTDIATLMATHGERLLERNIRRYLGLHGNRVNQAIRQTLYSAEPANFYFFNNGVTLVCSDFSYNALQAGDYQIKVDDMQIVNGGQSCMTIYKTILEMQEQGHPLPTHASVLVRLVKLPKGNEDMVLQITQATNSQNPVDLKDLRANDERQHQLADSIAALGFEYRRKRTDGPVRPDEVTPGVAAEAILAVWRNAPHQAKFFTREHFGKLYDTIFSASLNGAQVIVAVLLYRIAENRRRRPASADPQLVRYGSCFIAMQMGKHLLRDLAISQADLTHENFAKAKGLLAQRSEHYFMAAVQEVDAALEQLYGTQAVSMQQLSATFRRGDLIGRLP